MYSTVSYGQFSILAIGGTLETKWPDLHVPLARYTITPTDGRDTTIDAAGLTFTSGEVESNEHFVVVVRPDMYIGYVGGEEEASSYLSNLLIAKMD